MRSAATKPYVSGKVALPFSVALPMCRSPRARPFVAGPIKTLWQPGSVVVPSEVKSPSPLDGLATVILADSPIAYYKLDEASGTLAADSSGNANDATYGGTGAFSYQQTLGTRVGIGVSPSVLVKTPANVMKIATSASAKSFECLVKTTDTDGALFYIGTVTTTTPVAVICLGFNAVDNNGTGKLSLLVRDTGGNLSHASAAAAINDGNLHHVVVTRSTGKVWNVYVDGNSTPVITFTDAFTGGITPDDLSDAPGVSGPLYGTNAQCFLTGTMGQVAIYNTALSTTQIAAHFAAV